MLVQLFGNRDNLNDDLPYLKALLKAVHSTGASPLNDWISDASKQQRNQEAPVTPDWKNDYRSSISAIDRADAIIIEATGYGFEEGLFMSQALLRKKPTLVLTRQSTDSNIMGGISHNLLTIQHYSTDEEIQAATTKFLQENRVSTKDLRFNFFIDRQIYSYLRQTSYETGRNKSEIIRQVIEEEIDKREG